MIAPNPTLVHSKETSPPPLSGTSYQDYRIAENPEAWNRAQVLYALLDVRDDTDRSTVLAGCRTRAWFARNVHDGYVTVLSNACHLRWCPLCQRSTRIRIQYATLQWCKSIHRPKFLTLTMKHNDDPLAAQLSFLYRSFAKLRAKPLFAKPCRGGIFFFQVKLNKSKTQWHPHLHVILDSDFILHKDLSQAWKKITKTSNVLDIREVTDFEKSADYVARYCASPANLQDIPDAKALELLSSLHGRRLCGTWGTAVGVHLHKPPPPVKADWQNVGGYWTVTSFMHYDDTAKAIYDAWLHRTALADGVTLFPGVPEIAASPTLAEPDPSLAWKQLPLPFR